MLSVLVFKHLREKKIMCICVVRALKKLNNCNFLVGFSFFFLYIFFLISLTLSFISHNSDFSNFSQNYDIVCPFQCFNS